MPVTQKLTLFFLRIALGWMFFYAGITKITNSSWSAAGYMKGAKTFPEFYTWLIQPNILPIVNFVNEWGLTLLGVSLILGIFVRLSSILGAALMILYYLPLLNFPYPNPNSYIVDQHIIFALGLLLLAAFRAGRVYGLENHIQLFKNNPRVRAWLG